MAAEPKWKETLRASERERDLNWLALTAVVEGAPYHKERFTMDGDRYVMTLYVPTHSHGGIVVVEARIKDQRVSVRAYYFDDLYRDREKMLLARGGVPWVTALDNLNQRRHEALAEV